MQKDKKYHIATCLTITNLTFVLLAIIPVLYFGFKKLPLLFYLVLIIFSSLFAFSFFTTFKETINDLIYSNGTFDIEDIKANAIGSIIGGILLCIIVLRFFYF